MCRDSIGNSRVSEIHPANMHTPYETSMLQAVLLRLCENSKSVREIVKLLALKKGFVLVECSFGDPCKIDQSEVEEDLEAQKAKTDAVTRRMIELERQMRETQNELCQ